MRRHRARSSWSRRKTAVYLVCVIAVWGASMALVYALEIRDRGAAAVVVTAGMGVFVVLFLVFVVRSVKEQ